MLCIIVLANSQYNIPLTLSNENVPQHPGLTDKCFWGQHFINLNKVLSAKSPLTVALSGHSIFTSLFHNRHSLLKFTSKATSPSIHVHSLLSSHSRPSAFYTFIQRLFVPASLVVIIFDFPCWLFLSIPSCPLKVSPVYLVLIKPLVFIRFHYRLFHLFHGLSPSRPVCKVVGLGYLSTGCLGHRPSVGWRAHSVQPLPLSEAPG